jgi:hypothetical protein
MSNPRGLDEAKRNPGPAVPNYARPEPGSIRATTPTVPA